MVKSSRQSFLHGAAILMVSLVVVKILGFVFKIPLTNILGGVGMGYYNTAFMLFSPVYALATGGFPSAVSKMVAENAELGRFRDVKKILKVSMLFYMVAGLVGTLAMVVFSNLFCTVVGNPNAYFAVLSIAPTIFFGCLIAAYRGYYEGLCDMRPTAISQVVEMVVKLIVGLAAAVLVIQYAEQCFLTTGIVFGVSVSDMDQTHSAAMPYAAAASVLGVTFSNLVGAIYLIIRYRRDKGIKKEELDSSPKPERARYLLKNLVKIAFPICLGGIVANMTSLIDLISMMNQLRYLVVNKLDELMELYSAVIPANMPVQDIPNYLYGSYTGLAVSIFSIVPAVTAVLAKSALPSITSSWVRNDRNGIRRSIEMVMRISSVVVIPSGFGIAILAKPILSLLFSSRPNEVELAWTSLAIMGVGVIFLALSTPLFAVMQAIGRADLPVKHMIIGSILKLALNIWLVSVPRLNINGAAIATTVCYAFIFFLELIALVKITGMKFRFGTMFFKPMFAALFCAAGAYAANGLCCRVFPQKVSVLIAIVVSAMIYLIVLFSIKGITKSDLLSLPMGKKVLKVLENLGFML